MNLSIGNLNFFDNDKPQRPISKIHLHVKQRNKKKMLTWVEGLADDLDLDKILKFLKKNLNTNGGVLTNEDGRKIIQVAGDKRQEIKEFFVKYQIWSEPDPPIVVHGF